MRGRDMGCISGDGGERGELVMTRIAVVNEHSSNCNEHALRGINFRIIRNWEPDR